MTRLNKLILMLCLPLLFAGITGANAALPALESVLQKGFPTQPAELEKTTNALFNEYQSEKNVSSLIFYSYGMLRLADHYKTVGDYVNASEYSKLGFFYLDEAADLHENDSRVRYLRVRIDAYLPAELGRCIVALSDTDNLLEKQENFDSEVLANINYMRYRALLGCQEYQRAEKLLAEMKEGTPVQVKLLSLAADTAPEWSISEVTQIIMPLAKGE